MLARVLAAMACCCVLGVPARAETRLGLLIGNEDYPASVGRLSRPHEDVAVIRAALEAVHFQVEVVHDADRRLMLHSIQAFARRLADARAGGGAVVGFFYYMSSG